MRYVVDSSVAFKWVVTEVDSDKALRLLADYENAVHELLAPDLFLTEIANALASAEKSGRIQPGEAIALLTDIVNKAREESPAVFPIYCAAFVPPLTPLMTRTWSVQRREQPACRRRLLG